MDKKGKKSLSLKDILITLFISFILCFIFSMFYRIASVDGISMDNTLYSSERVLVYTKAYNHSQPSRGDIVIAKMDNYETKYLIKRVIGLPGEILEIRDNVIYIDGVQYSEDYIKEPMVTADICVNIPEDEVFIMGDNRNVSYDSRNLTSVGTFNYRDEVVGKVIFNVSDFSPIH